MPRPNVAETTGGTQEDHLSAVDQIRRAHFPAMRTCECDMSDPDNEAMNRGLDWRLAPEGEEGKCEAEYAVIVELDAPEGLRRKLKMKRNHILLGAPLERVKYWDEYRKQQNKVFRARGGDGTLIETTHSREPSGPGIVMDR